MSARPSATGRWNKQGGASDTVSGAPLSIDVDLLEVDWSTAHATRSREGGEEGGERGYYHLHRKLNQAFLRHGSVR